jgi:1,4-alpha-glucan branching enzyme
MNTSTSKSGNRYSGRDSLRPINFFCEAPRARRVEIAGDFNHWNPVPMQRRVDGWWYSQILLCHGHHQYKFLIDGSATLDPAATGVGRDPNGAQVSLIAVS